MKNTWFWVRILCTIISYHRINLIDCLFSLPFPLFDPDFDSINQFIFLLQHFLFFKMLNNGKNCVEQFVIFLQQRFFTLKLSRMFQCKLKNISRHVDLFCSYSLQSTFWLLWKRNFYYDLLFWILPAINQIPLVEQRIRIRVCNRWSWIGRHLSLFDIDPRLI